MTDEKGSFDAGHYSFLEMIRVLHGIAGPAFTKGALIKTGMAAASRTPITEFKTFKEFVASIEQLENPITQFEGKARHYQHGVFGLPECPFARSIQTYLATGVALPPEYKDVTQELNKPSDITIKLRVGQGAAVSPFCGVHQPIRSALGSRVKIGGHTMEIYQLGCKSGSGAKGLSMNLIREIGQDPELVERILDENMCCYCVRLTES